MSAPSPEEPRSLDHGRYVLTRVLGTGATATVWQATDTVLGVQRAIKVLEGRASGTRQLRRRLLTEARTMAQLDHPGVLRIYDIGADGEQDFVVMDLIEGGTVGDRVQAEGPLPPALAIDLVIQLLSVLHTAHGRGIVHRDVKPHNLLLIDPHTVLLCDFGIAMLTEDQLRSTRTNIAMGSLAFMAPEQRLDARGVTHTADLYAAGATLYNLVTAANPVDLFTADPDSPRWAGVPDALREVIRRAVRLQAAARHPSAKALALDLLRVRPQLVGAEAAPPPATAEALALLGPGEPLDAALDAPTQVEEWSSDVLPIVAPPAPAPAAAEPAPVPPRSPSLVPGLVAAAVAIAALVLWVARPWQAGPDDGAGPASATVAAAPATLPVAVPAPGPASSSEPTSPPDPAPAADPAASTAPASSSKPPSPAPPTAAGASSAPDQTAATSPAAARAPAPAAGTPVDAPDGAPGAPAVDLAAVVGTWTGSMHASTARMELRESGGALRGTLRTTHPTTGAEQQVDVSGTLDGRRLRLADELRDDPTAGRYDATLSADGTVLEGTFRTFSGSRSFRFRLIRTGG